ncbi:MAG: PQQ-dependent sugar dehydrogenase [Vicinamibacterales bacterium]
MSHRREDRRPIAAAAALLATLAASAVSARAASLPAGFTETLVASGLSNPTAMQFAPDGRLFVCQQGGQLRVVKNGVLLAAPFLTVSVNQSGERGLLGVAFDPNFASNQYVYVYYTTSSAPLHNRVSRFTASGDTAAPGSEVTVVDLDALSGATNHNGGAINFGPDGKLYVAVGENANTANSQSLTTRHGKMLRLNADGSIPSDNPVSFLGIPGSTSGIYRAIWAVGLRNPFTFAFNPGGTPVMFLNDVGGGSWEEVNIGLAGANYGWPTTEGYTTNPNYTSPTYAYPHGGGSVTGCAITGGAFYNPATPLFPAAYLNTYFFADYCSGWIKRIDPTLTPGVPIDFATGINAPVDLEVGDDGHLYYLARGSGAVYRVQYGNAAPSITSHPSSLTVTIGQPASFSVGASGTPPLTYQWQRNGADIPGATQATYTIAVTQAGDDGARFRVNVANQAGNVFSNEAVLTVTANRPPTAVITTPSTALRYTGGMTIAFSGAGTDPEDGPRPASAFTWQVDFHHDTHVHPFLPATGGSTSGAFVVPVAGETSATVWFRIRLTVRDSGGLSTTVQRDVFPRTVRLTVATSPPGLEALLDGQPLPGPHAVDAVVGVRRTLRATPQIAAGTSYVFAGWSDGGAPARVIVTPPVDTTYTALFQAVGVTGPPAPPSALAAAVNGATVRFAWTRSAGAQAYRLEAGSAAGLSDLAVVNLADAAALQVAAPPGTYFVRLRAVNAAGTSGVSNEVTVVVTSTASCATAPPPPAGLTVQTGGRLVAFTWQAAPAATSYVLDVGQSTGATDVSLPLGAATSFQVVAPAGTYYARVRALNACGASSASVEVPVTSGCSTTAVVPADLTVSRSGSVATFSWLAPVGATSYRLRVGSAPGGSDVADADVGPSTTLAVALAGAAPSTYYVRVAAVSACGVGAPSNEVALAVP